MTREELRAFRLSLGLNQVQFGNELGIPNPQIQISHLETGKRKITRRLEASIRHWQEKLIAEKKLERT